MLTRAIFRAVGVELVCDMNIDVPVKLECLVPLCEFVPDLQFIVCQHGLDRHTWKSVFRCKKKVVLDFHGRKAGSIKRVARGYLLDTSEDSDRASWKCVKFAEVYFTKRHTWNYSSLPDHKLVKKFSVGWRVFLSNISDEWELNTWEENDANIMAHGNYYVTTEWKALCLL